MTNLIVSSYLTSAIDTQRGITTAPNNPEYIQKWCDSVLRHNLHGVILHDNLSYEFMAKFAGIEFVRVAKCPEGMQIYDYRYMLFLEFLQRIKPDAAFFTDIWDVEVINNPFPFIDSERLYCGDECGTLVQCAWLNPARENPVLQKLHMFIEIMNSSEQVLNPGIIGGSWSVMERFFNSFKWVINECVARPIEHTVDMAIFNYAMYYGQFNPIHGHPVNGVFRGGKSETDVWFQHK